MKNKGCVIIIGGAEDKKGDSVILKQAPEMLMENDILTVLTTATEHRGKRGGYHEAFTRLGVETSDSEYQHAG